MYVFYTFFDHVHTPTMYVKKLFRTQGGRILAILAAIGHRFTAKNADERVWDQKPERLCFRP